MKLRQMFVSNSSSSSFFIQLKDETDLKTFIEENKFLHFEVLDQKFIDNLNNESIDKTKNTLYIEIDLWNSIEEENIYENPDICNIIKL